MGNQNPYIEGQITQWPKEKKYKKTNNDLQSIHRVTRTQLKNGVNSGAAKCYN